MIEKLVEAKRLGTAIDGQVVEWLKGIDSTLRGRLAKAGLVEAGQSRPAWGRSWMPTLSSGVSGVT